MGNRIFSAFLIACAFTIGVAQAQTQPVDWSHLEGVMSHQSLGLPIFNCFNGKYDSKKLPDYSILFTPGSTRKTVNDTDVSTVMVMQPHDYHFGPGAVAPFLLTGELVRHDDGLSVVTFGARDMYGTGDLKNVWVLTVKFGANDRVTDGAVVPYSKDPRDPSKTIVGKTSAVQCMAFGWD